MSFEENEDNQWIIDEIEIKDAFLEFMTGVMSGYTKCLLAPGSNK